MGTPEFAVPSLERLLALDYPVVGVFTQPDRPKNRGMKLTASPVKVCAQSHGLEVYQPSSFKKDPEAVEILRGLQPDLIVVAAFGQILPQTVLDIPRYGCINVHSSLLPKYRGAAPVNWAILNGEKETGVTIMKLVLALDAGDILLQEKTEIAPEETADELISRLSRMGADLLEQVIPEIEQGRIEPVPQDDAESSYAPMLTRDLSPMDWTRTAQELHDQVRGLIPWPVASAELGGVRFKIYRTEVGKQNTDKEPGAVISAGNDGILVACGGGGTLRILELQAPGKKRMPAADYLRGHPAVFQ